MARRLLDSMRTSFGDSIKALLYSPLLKVSHVVLMVNLCISVVRSILIAYSFQRANNILTSVNPRQLIINFVCYATGNI